MSRTRAPIVGLIFGFAVFTSAFAEENANPFADYARCAAIRSDAERLACFDELAPRMEAAAGEARNGLLAETKADLASKRADAFGGEAFEEDAGMGEVEKLSGIRSAVAKIDVMQDRRLKFTLENGQVWRQKPDDRIIPAPKEGVERSVEINRAMFGRYIMTIEPEGRTIRVERQE
ncbi:MAG: hypothetical protein RIE56_01180 [Amphiplicatus sp.]